MSKYFISVYKNYLNKIESNKTMETKYKALKDKMTLLNTSFNNCVDSIENSSWTESGKGQIISKYLPKIRINNNILINGILNDMDKVISLVKNDLYKMLVELREQDNEYCLIQEKLKSNDIEKSEIEYLEGKIKVLDTILVNLVKSIDNKIIEIKSYNDLDESTSGEYSLLEDIDLSAKRDALLKLYSKTHNRKKDDSIVGELKAKIEENKIKKIFKGSLNIKKSGLAYLPDIDNEPEKVETPNKDFENANCVDLSLLNENWKVVDTKLSVQEYAKEAYSKGIRQNSNTERYSDYCLAFSYVHASNLYNGNVDANAECAYNWKHSTEFCDYFNDSKQETLKTVYNQVIEGKPVVMQVNGNSKGTSRHFVTVVGVKSSVPNADAIKESDLLILDSWDGKLERMDTDTSRFMTTGKDTKKSYSGYYLRILK